MKWYYYESNETQLFNDCAIHTIYKEMVDKSDYPDFDCWLYDMEKMQILNRA